MVRCFRRRGMSVGSKLFVLVMWRLPGCRKGCGLLDPIIRLPCRGQLRMFDVSRVTLRRDLIQRAAWSFLPSPGCSLPSRRVRAAGRHRATSSSSPTTFATSVVLNNTLMMMMMRLRYLKGNPTVMGCRAKTTTESGDLLRLAYHWTLPDL